MWFWHHSSPQTSGSISPFTFLSIWRGFLRLLRGGKVSTTKMELYPVILTETVLYPVTVSKALLWTVIITEQELQS